VLDPLLRKLKMRNTTGRNKEIEATVASRVQRSLITIRQTAKSEAEATFSVVIRERELELAGLRRQIDELKQRSDQSSQQLQGEAQEKDLQQALVHAFPRDRIEPVGKGKAGADIVHRVASRSGDHIGTILWEAKRTKSWSPSWLAKLAEDQRRVKADAAVIVSRTLPNGLDTFDLVNGLWVTHPRHAISLAAALRQFLLEIARVKRFGATPQNRAAQLHRFITGPDFRQHVTRIVEQFAVMKNDLERERATTTRSWAKREAQILAAVESTAAVCTQLEITLGSRIVEIDGFPQFPMIEAPSR
jgi:hypothetical protein